MRDYILNTIKNSFRHEDDEISIIELENAGFMVYYI
jgi:hypothetical protein